MIYLLVRFRTKNFLSFQNEIVFDMTAGKGRSFNNRVYKYEGNKVLKFASLFGANGSGKSNLVKAIDFSKDYIIKNNDNSVIPCFYRINENSKFETSIFEYEIELNNVIYKYGFELVLFNNSLKREWLSLIKSNKQINIFSREIDKGEYIIGEYFSDKSLINILQVFADGIKAENSILFLKNINQYKNIFEDFSEALIMKKIYDWFRFKLIVKSPESVLNDYAFFMSSKNIEAIQNFFNDFDLSISKYEFVYCPLEKIALQLPREIFQDFKNKLISDLNNAPNSQVMFGINDDFYLAELDSGELKCETIVFYHGNSNAAFSMSEEPDGTKKIFKLMEILFQEDDDVTYIVDEVDRCLHPLLTYNFINAYLKQKAPDKKCQLIVTSHECLLIDFSLLRKDEIWFVEKKDNASNLIAIGNTTERADKKLIKSHLLGEIAAPKIKDDAYRRNNQ